MTYQELLLDKKWRSKRNTILVDSHWTCSNCQNQQIINRSTEAVINRLTWKHTEPTNIVITPFIKRFELEITPISGTERHTVTLHTYGTPSQTNFHDYKLYFEIETSGDRQKIIINAISELRGNDYLKWHHVRGLHVHHKYYQDNLKPWEYPHSALTTLCWICHKQLHENNNIQYLDANGNEKGKFTPCFRCHGAGYFPEYDHVEDGICFRCNGARYEELIPVAKQQ